MHAKYLIACVYVELSLERGGLSPSRDNRLFISFHMVLYTEPWIGAKKAVF